MTIILWGCILTTLIQIIFWIFLFSKLAFYKEPHRSLAESEKEPVSIIICAKDEAQNLSVNLPRILNQNDRSYEVLVVNDNSKDNTLEILTYLCQEYSHLRIVNFYNKKKSQVGKKFALTRGIEEARHEILLLTDADCCPTSSNWLSEMRAALNKSTEIGLGYGPYYSKPGFLNKLIRFETVYTAIQYLSFALSGMPYMGVGRNLIYKKSLFRKANGFKTHEDIASGDDDLFINTVATSENTTIILKPTTFMLSPSKETWRDWFRQKSRHLSTGKRYRTKHKILLGLLSASHLAHYATVIIVGLKISITLMIFIYVLRMAVILFFYSRILKKLQDHSLLNWIPILDVVFALYYVVFAPILFIGKTKRWK